jgi:hypothetical protein
MRHCLDDAKHSGDDAEGWECVGHVLERVGAVQLLVERLFELARHEVLDLVGIVGVHADHAQIVTDHRAGEFVGENLGELLERGTLSGVFDMRLKRPGESGEKPTVRSGQRGSRHPSQQPCA